MKKRIGNTKTYSYLERIDSHLDDLHQDGKLSEPLRGAFFEEVYGCHNKSWKNWYNQGVRKIYITVIDLFDEIRDYKKRIKKLEEEIKELTTKP